MKITVLNGSPPDGYPDFEKYISSLVSRINSNGHQAENVNISALKIKPCTGCFGCWVKTPGECVIPDDAIDLTKKYLESDMVIFASPLINGYFSYILKNAIDRNIPVIHPHLENVHGEVHHVKRYETYPSVGIILSRDESTDDEDVDIAKELFHRMGINMRTDIRFITFTDTPAEEAADAINAN